MKVTNGFFLIGLNAADAEMQRNVQLLKERTWFDILIVYAQRGPRYPDHGKGPGRGTRLRGRVCGLGQLSAILRLSAGAAECCSG